MLDRAVFGYVVGIDGVAVTLNLRSEHRGFVASHRQGVTGLLETGSLFGVGNGATILVLRVASLQFAEPREVHFQSKHSSPSNDEPLRHLRAITVGRLVRLGKKLEFFGDALTSPPLGAEAFPLTDLETRAIYAFPPDDSPELMLGKTVRGQDELRISLDRLLPRHVAVLGGTGQGKSCFTAAMLQQMAPLAQSRIVVFDINGEYEEALEPHCNAGELKVTRLGSVDEHDEEGYRIPYYALGRAGLSRLLLPSEKTQRPAFNFALETLPYVKYLNDGACLAAERKACLFDDGRIDHATEAYNAIQALRNRSDLNLADNWPPMAAIAALVAESQCLKWDGNKKCAVRDGWLYGNISTLVNRIHRRIDDPMFRSIVDVEGGKEIGDDDWNSASQRLIKDLFGSKSTPWKVHIVDLRRVTHDLLPSILGALLELYAYRLFIQGQGSGFPTLLVLEEAHHYLRSVLGDDDSAHDALAYERLAKEGRKFGLSLWISTQRPSEVSSAVLSQCGTWICFRVIGTADTNAIGAATEWLDKRELSAISGLPRQQALFFGAGVPLPTRIVIPDANPKPRSSDPAFSQWNRAQVKKKTDRDSPGRKSGAAPKKKNNFEYNRNKDDKKEKPN
jgi:hypothetical protein